ncbi:phosphate system positive regulatory protein pho81, partial [Dimargaris xerosporica]
VNEFYMQKESELKLRLRSLLEKKRLLYREHPENIYRTSLLALKEAFAQFQHDLDKLQQFVEINGTGFRKILKKWDKRAKSSTKELYLSRQVEIQPCFNQDVVADLADTAATHLADLTAKLDEWDLPASERLPAMVDSVSLLCESPTGGVGPGSPAERSHLKEVEASLYEALIGGHQAMVDELVAQMVASDETPTGKAAIAHCFARLCWRACSDGVWNSCLQTFVAKHAVDLAFVDDINDRTCLHEAAIHGQTKFFECLCHTSAAVDLNRRDYYGRTALHYATMHGHTEFVRLLLASGSGIQLAITDHDGHDPLTYAVVRGTWQSVQLLLNHQPDLVRCNHQLSLFLACQYGRQDMVTLMLSKGAQLVPDDNGTHPLHLTAREGHATLTELLIAHGADVDVLDKDNGWSPLFYAVHQGHIRCVQVLLASHCRVDLLDDDGKTPLYYAAFNGHTAVVEVLVAAGCTVPDPNSTPTKSPVSSLTQPPLPISASGPLEVSLLSLADFDAMPRWDMDQIPSLSLPPPIIPVRTYGHKYLDHKYHLQLALGHTAPLYPERPPILLHGNTPISTLRLCITPKPDNGVIPQTLLLPLDPDQRVVSFLLPMRHAFSLEFGIYPTFGSKVIGKAVVLSPSLGLAMATGNAAVSTTVTKSTDPGTIFTTTGYAGPLSTTTNTTRRTTEPTTKAMSGSHTLASPLVRSGQSQGHLVCPLLDNRLRVVGQLAFEYRLITPLAGVKLEIGGPVQTYWKSTNTPQPPTNPSGLSGSTGPARSLSHTPVLFSPSAPSSYLGPMLSSPGMPTAAMASPEVAAGTPSKRLEHAQSTLAKGSTSRPKSGNTTPLQGTLPSLGTSTSRITFVTASSLAEQHVHLIVHVTRNLVPVVYPYSRLSICKGFELNMTAVTTHQFDQLGRQQLDLAQVLPDPMAPPSQQDERTQRIQWANGGSLPTSPQEWCRALHRAYITLEDALRLLPSHLGVCVDIQYPTPDVTMPASSANVTAQGPVDETQWPSFNATTDPTSLLDSSPPDVNAYVDAILQTVYLDAERSKSSLVAKASSNASATPDKEPRSQRNIFFVSFHCEVCTALNWKQPNYAVFYGITSGFAHATRSSHLPAGLSAGAQDVPDQVQCKRPRTDSCAVDATMDWASALPLSPTQAPWPVFDHRIPPVSIKDAIKFSRRNHLLGILCDAQLLVKVPALITTVKQSGLVLATFGSSQDDAIGLATQRTHGVDAALVDGVFHYNHGSDANHSNINDLASL